MLGSVVGSGDNSGWKFLPEKSVRSSGNEVADWGQNLLVVPDYLLVVLMLCVHMENPERATVSCFPFDS